MLVPWEGGRGAVGAANIERMTLLGQSLVGFAAPGLRHMSSSSADGGTVPCPPLGTEIIHFYLRQGLPKGTAGHDNYSAVHRGAELGFFTPEKR